MDESLTGLGLGLASSGARLTMQPRSLVWCRMFVRFGGTAEDAIAGIASGVRTGSLLRNHRPGAATYHLWECERFTRRRAQRHGNLKGSYWLDPPEHDRRPGALSIRSSGCR